MDTISKLKNHSSHVVLNELCGLRDSIANSSAPSQSLDAVEDSPPDFAPKLPV